MTLLDLLTILGGFSAGVIVGFALIVIGLVWLYNRAV